MYNTWLALWPILQAVLFPHFKSFVLFIIIFSCQLNVCKQSRKKSPYVYVFVVFSQLFAPYPCRCCRCRIVCLLYVKEFYNFITILYCTKRTSFPGRVSGAREWLLWGIFVGLSAPSLYGVCVCMFCIYVQRITKTTSRRIKELFCIHKY